jgi:uncharacterized membrane protein YfcA
LRPAFSPSRALSAFADISLLQLLLVAGVALFASVIGGVAGYGTGALMPLVLVPMVGAEPVVPIIAISALFTNVGRAAAFRVFIDWRKTLIVLIGSIPFGMLTAWGYTFLTGRGAMLVIGTMLILTVPLRMLLKRRAVVLGDRGLLIGGAGYGAAAGGTVGAGVVLLALLMAAGLEGAAVVATDAAVSIVVSSARTLVFGVAGVVDLKVLTFATLIGLIAIPGAFIARALVAHMPLRAHTAILDAVVAIGGAVMVYRALAA